LFINANLDPVAVRLASVGEFEHATAGKRDCWKRLADLFSMKE
jgi:hypothetical protein